MNSAAPGQGGSTPSRACADAPAADASVSGGIPTSGRSGLANGDADVGGERQAGLLDDDAQGPDPRSQPGILAQPALFRRVPDARPASGHAFGPEEGSLRIEATDMVEDFARSCPAHPGPQKAGPVVLAYRPPAVAANERVGERSRQIVDQGQAG